MSASGSYNDDRMPQLLADRATEGLERTDAAALDQWLARNPSVDAYAFERVAAVVALTGVSVDEEALPASVRGKIFADADLFFAGAGWNGT